MSIIRFLKSRFSYITLIILLIAIFDIYLFCLNSFDNKYWELLYTNAIVLIVIVLFLFVDYNKWKSKYHVIYENIKNKREISEESIYGSSFEEEIIKGVIKRINEKNDIKISDYRKREQETDEYISKWVHEAKLPLSSLNIISERLDNPEDSISIKNEIEKMNFLVNSVLYGSRSMSLSEDIFINKINLESLIKKSIKNNAFLLIKNNVDVELTDLDYEIYTDTKNILYVFDQIINNAIKYSKGSGKIEFRSERYENEIVLFIKDYGIGIEKEDIGRIFDKGFTGSNGREQIYKSTGMGLYFSKNILEKLGHKVEVNSVKDIYTEFKIHFYNISDYFVLSDDT